MDVARLNQVLAIFAWFPLAVLLAIVLLIARFYQRLTGENTRYPLYAAPILLFGPPPTMPLPGEAEERRWGMA